MSNNFYNTLTNQYSVNKVLKFELKPIGATREHIHTKKLLEADKTVAEGYKEIKRENVNR